MSRDPDAPPARTSPRISVAMSVYNNAPYIAASIESILQQSFADFEFLIVDDGSTDGSGAIIDRYAATDSRIRAVHQTNRGLIASLNRLIGEARAPLIARMDGDDISHPDRFERQLDFLDANPDHGAVGSWSHDIDARGATRTDPYRQPPTSHDALLATLEQGPLMCHSSVLMRRDLVIAAGGYRPAFRHCEDYDLWLRLAERTRLCSIAEPLIFYRYSPYQISSLHVTSQQYGAAVAFAAHRERIAGRRDPTEGLSQLPPLAELDNLFGREGVGREIRDKLVRGIVHSPHALRGDGFELLLCHVREGGARDGLWRAAGRLVKLGVPARALRLAAALATR